jgi:hypothetical protein
MHYRNGKEAHNGDRIVMLDNEGEIVAFGVLHSAEAGNDYCNGNIAIVQPTDQYACLCDCLHIDDIADMVKEKGLQERAEGM